MLDEVKAYIQEPAEYTCDCPSAITRAYTLTRYMFACCNRGAFPVLYTGMLFNLMPGAGEHLSFWTFARGYTSQPGEPTLELNPDERSWCTEHLWAEPASSVPLAAAARGNRGDAGAVPLHAPVLGPQPGTGEGVLPC